MKKQKSIALHIKNCDKKDPENFLKTPPHPFSSKNVINQ